MRSEQCLISGLGLCQSAHFQVSLREVPQDGYFGVSFLGVPGEWKSLAKMVEGTFRFTAIQVHAADVCECAGLPDLVPILDEDVQGPVEAIQRTIEIAFLVPHQADVDCG